MHRQMLTYLKSCIKFLPSFCECATVIFQSIYRHAALRADTHVDLFTVEFSCLNLHYNIKLRPIYFMNEKRKKYQRRELTAWVAQPRSDIKGKILGTDARLINIFDHFLESF